MPEFRRGFCEMAILDPRSDIWETGYQPNHGRIGRDQRRISMTFLSTATQIGRGAVVAGALAALTLTTAPTPAHAGGPGVGAAIGLGILGGVIAGAAIASSQPVYGAPPPYDYPPQYYYQPAPGYYAPQPYYGSTPYGYPQ
jgi:hypothetical protein